MNLGESICKEKAMTNPAKIEVNGKSLELPETVGSEGEIGLDISQLRSKTGAVTLDYGYANTGSTESAITFIDGEKGILRYRGYPIEQLAEHSNFQEVSYLLYHGELPTKEQLDKFKGNISQHTMLHERARRMFEAFTKDAHPMAMLVTGVAALSAYYFEENANPDDEEATMLAMYRLMGKLPTIAAAGYKMTIGQPYVYPSNSLDYTGNFLNMMFSVPAEPYEIHPDVAKALDILLILHADHEQNCSTSTVRLVGSSHANVYASVSAGISALWGPLHGGANQAVLEMLEGIRNRGMTMKDFITEVKDKDSHARLMGFGHRVYKNFDPRARIIKVFADKVLKHMGVDDPLLEMGKELEEAALKDDYFISRKLYPNVDFYSGIIYRALGIPKNMFTVMFALGRLPGWVAHWREMQSSPKTKIGRPRQIYTGYTERNFVPLDKR